MTVAGDIGGARLQIARPLGCRQHESGCPLHRDIAVEKAKWIGDHARIQVVFSGQGRFVEVGLGVFVRVLALGHGKSCHLLPILVVPF